MTVALPDQELEAVRRRAFGVGYRMLGSVTEAEDVAQEAVLRLSQADGPIDEPAAWITTAATRLSIDLLRSARKRREAYVGPWLPEPLLEDPTPGPASQAERADSLSQAFLVLLERLSPVERAVFVLREVFDYDYARIAEIVDRSEENCRQIVTRSKKHIEARRPRFDPDEELRDELLERFLRAANEGDVEGLEELLAEDAEFYSDGGGKVSAARKPLFGANRIARVLVKFTEKVAPYGPFSVELLRVNGQPGRVMRLSDGTLYDVLTIDVVDGKIRTVRVIRNPDKLQHV